MSKTLREKVVIAMFPSWRLRSRESGHRHVPELAAQSQADFINYVKANHSDDILCLAGDFYNDVHKTLEFVKELENNRVLGFFVLGNHDYWNHGMLSHEEIISLFDIETMEHRWFRFLATGKKFYVDDLCFIGDTGWTSFKRGKKIRQVTLKQFMALPDAFNVRGFHPKKIRDYHIKWVEFANSVLIQEQKVIIMTHFPMIDFTRYDRDCWWSSRTQLLNSENQWRIFGHTHQYKYGSHFNLTCQRGYGNKKIEENTPELYCEMSAKMLEDRRSTSSSKYKPSEQEVLRRIKNITSQYLSKDFEMLHKVSDSRELSVPFQNIMAKFYTPALVEDPNEKSEFSKSVKYSGYRRPAANIINFAYLAYDRVDYLKIVRSEIDGVAGMGKVRIGYYCMPEYIKQEIIDALYIAADYLEHNDIGADIHAFITAAILTGYAWNRSIVWMGSMRLVNDYDIARFFLQFKTMQKFNIKFDEIYTIQRSKKDKITFGNIKLWLPMVNGKQLTVEQAMIALSSTPLIGHINPDANG